MESVKDEAVGCPGEFKQAIIESRDSVYFAKRILLELKVKDFHAADVVALARVIILREQLLRTGVESGVRCVGCNHD